MKRSIEIELLKWKSQKNRMPLLIRGARQVGKTYVVEKFGKENFDSLISINFEQYPEIKKCFHSLDLKQILFEIEILTGKSIIAGKSLLFLDEIQECPKALMALRYFKEQIPTLHVIGAGSLLEFTLGDSDFRMPVGRVEFLYLHPLSFKEFLIAADLIKLNDSLPTMTLKNPCSELIHEKYLKHLREYLAIGGMPAVIANYLENKNLARCQTIQSALLVSFRDDFRKYAKKRHQPYLQTLFEKIPGFVGEWIKYSKIDPNLRSRELKETIQLLCNAGLINRVNATSASGIPLVTHVNEKKFKLIFLDIGLLKRAGHLDLKLLFQDDPLLNHKGILSEQFVGQELLAYSRKEEPSRLFFWVRDKKSSSSEVDYVIEVNNIVVPIEVKSASSSKLKSLKTFMKEKRSLIGIRISKAPLSFEKGILSIPFYLISELPRLINEAISSNM